MEVPENKNMPDQIREIIAEELKKISVGAEGADLEQPKKLGNGDFSFFVKDKEINVEELPLSKIKHEYIEKTEALGQFINFYLSEKFFHDSLGLILNAGQSFGQNQNLAGKKIIIEYTDPNPFKEFHIGHLMSNSIGEALSRVIAWSGAEVSRANYQGDVGPHVAKAIWGIRKLLKEKPNARPVDGAPLSEKSAFLGKAYVLGSNSYEEDETAKKEIDELNKTIYEKSDAEINALYDWGRKISLEHFETLYKKLGTNFDFYFFESEAAPIGLNAVEELTKKGILEKSDGAIVFKGEQYGLHTRVFVNSKGLPTYETKELGLTKLKFDRQDFDQSIVVTANEQSDYFTVVLKVLEFVDHRAANRTRHVSHGMMRFAEGKMSSRKGNVITGESLVRDVEKVAEEKFQDRDVSMSEEEKKIVAEQVAVGAIKFSILKQSPGRDIVFDFAKSLSLDGDSGPYLQYTHARINSLLRKAEDAGVTESLANPEKPGTIEHLLVRFPEIVVRAQKEFAPQLIVTYLINLVSAFNNYYAQNVIVDKNKTESAYRVALTRAMKNVLAGGLYLLGIAAPERM